VGGLKGPHGDIPESGKKGLDVYISKQHAKSGQEKPKKKNLEDGVGSGCCLLKK